MFVKRKPLRAESEAFVHLEKRRPVRNVFVNEKRQTEEIIHLLFVIEIKLGDAYEQCRFSRVYLMQGVISI